MTGQPGCVIFDLDGTLVETEQIWGSERREFVESHGGHWREDAQRTMIGMRTTEWAEYIHTTLGVDMPPREIADAVVAAMVKRLVNPPILPGAQHALEQLSLSFRLGLATSAALPVATAVLERTGWRRFFEAVISADEVERGKPAPDVYLRALETMSAQASCTAAVEDSANGIRSAHAARLAVVAVPNREFRPDDSALALASRVIPDLNGLHRSTIRDVLTR
ncbi:MAG: HAD family phosphatase [Candidatus Eremiobacteraeota bacterium]|nr:HAD family phosphatase [Candidatus Eremiobacteraeota bacterium]